MTAPAPHSTLRELRAHLGAPFVLAAQAGIAVILGFSGPFETWTALTLGGRLAYWGVVVFGTYALGAALTLGVASRFDGHGRLVQVAAGGVVIGAAVTVFLGAVNWLAFGAQGGGVVVSIDAIVLAFVVSWVVLGLRAIAPRVPAQPAPAASHTPALLQRLPLNRRGQLVALSVQDHYVEVSTTGGRAMVLMRLSDAMAEAAPVPGLQIHRSHWVALDQVRAARRQGDGGVVTLSDGRDLPISRSRMASARAAGLLP